MTTETALEPKRRHGAVLLCGGNGRRMQGQVTDKVRVAMNGRPLWLHAVAAFRQAGFFAEVVVVYRDAEQKEALVGDLASIDTANWTVTWAPGGKERQDSVRHGLEALSPQVDYASIHDCARPLITPANLHDLCTAVEGDHAAVLAHRVTDTIKRSPESRERLDRLALEDLPRAELWAMETPQVFARELVLAAYAQLAADGGAVTDDVAAVQRCGHPVTLVENHTPNPKLTHPGDLDLLAFLLAQRQPPASAEA